MGAVYQVVHTETDRHRALKVILPSFLQSEEKHGQFGSAKLVAEGAT